MPELPEVETVRRGLAEHVVGRTIVGATVVWYKTVHPHAVDDFISRVAGRTIAAAHRRGKYILLELDNGMHMSIHLRMTGRLLVLPAGVAPGPHTRLIWSLSDGQELHFADPRKFGRVNLLDAVAMSALDAKLGPEPLAGAGPGELYLALQRRSVAIKSVLLDQSVIAGIGNIYADESLFVAGIDPRRPACSLSTEEAATLLQCVRSVLASAVDRHGTTLADEQFKGLEGRMGQNQGYLAVFRRTGEPCPRCGTAIERVRLGGRSTHFCPHCQT
jgi:formamidopyrimidine-DNA glycosylase